MNPSTAGAGLPALRSHNAALVLGLLRAAVASGGGISRSELAAGTGLTPQAVSKITARLRAAGLVEEAGRRASTGGKPSTGLRLATRARYAVGVHLDGELLSAVVSDLAGRPVAHHTAPLDLARPVGQGLAAITREIGCAIGLAPGPVLGIGIGVRGPLDHTTGTLHRVTGYPHWAGHPLRASLTHRLGLPVTVDKNTNAAALAVLHACPAGAPADVSAGARQGVPPEGGADSGPPEGPVGVADEGAPAGGPAGGGSPAGDTGPRSFAYLHLGTGLGASLVLDSGLYRGGRTGAGEFGHQAVLLDGPVCECGNRGCLEVLCLDAVGRGDPRAAARLLGVGAANLVALLDIDHLVLGGRTVLRAPAVFREEVIAVLAERSRAVPVTVAGPHAVAEGAALLALAPLFAHGGLV